MKKQSGFSLIELLVVVTIIAILSAVGIAAFRSVSSDARDAKRKADIDAIVKALENQFDSDTGTYPDSLQDSYFTSGAAPKKPDGTDYDLTFSPVANPEGFKVCVTLEKDDTEYCKQSSQGKFTTTSEPLAPSCSTTFPQNCKGDSGYLVYVYTPAYIDCPATPLNCSGNSNYLGTFSYWNEVGVMQGNVMIYGEQATQATLPTFEGNTLKDIEVREHQN